MRWKRGHRLKLVGDSEASGRTREIFREVRQSLGTPAVPMLYRAYAVCPKFLEIHWEAFRPAVRSRRFFLLGARLAAESYTRVHNYCDVPPLPRREASRDAAAGLSISQALDYYQYLDPLLLLITAAQMQTFEEPIGQPLGDVEPALHPEFILAPPLVRDENADPALQPSWQERNRILELAFISDEHRALAYWPDFYVEYWAALKELLQSPVYADCQYRLADSALSMAAELPGPVDTTVSQLLDAGLTDQQVTTIARVNQAFMQALTGLVLDMTFARIGLERSAAEQNAHKGPVEDSRERKTGSPVRAA